ncbi:hypothetical protein BX666DRAFT_1896196 [Dichotomocladium elegans]|nr:hypothetical protein BX666DRAFT_1896196 [Dichotomocladium elegans]
MNSKRPSWLILALGSVGLIEIPLTVNCWYCNSDTQLAKDSKETERCWHCNICGNTNLRDEVNISSFNDIVARSS